MATRTINQGDVFNITDRGWSSSGFYNGEGTLTWKEKTAIQAGTIIYIDTKANKYATDASLPFSQTGEFDISELGDELLIYTGTDNTPSFIYGINWSSNGWINDVPITNTTISSLPAGLTNGWTAVAFPTVKGIYVYNECIDLSSSFKLEISPYSSH